MDGESSKEIYKYSSSDLSLCLMPIVLPECTLTIAVVRTGKGGITISIGYAPHTSRKATGKHLEIEVRDEAGDYPEKLSGIEGIEGNIVVGGWRT